ncbi:MAG: M23 family metallopeptidase, partial [Bacteroidales bacterium]
DHGNGLTTVYGHLNDILVRQGQRVSSGEVIGRVGNSGTSFAPHLHYGVSLNGKPQDPVNYFFGDLDGNNYREMLIIATNTGQSLD